MQSQAESCGYGSVIERFLMRELPELKTNASATFEYLSQEVIGTKQRRNGPLPSPESQVDLRTYLRENKKLQFFIPWGCSKQDGGPPDILEVLAIQDLKNLEEAVRRCGWSAEFTFRFEDLTDAVLFPARDPSVMSSYYAAMASLMSNASMRPLAESSCVRRERFQADVDDYKGAMLDAMAAVEVEDRRSILRDIGWQGGLPQVQVAHYLKLYRKWYPNEDALAVLARYFTCALVRRKLDATCVPRAPHLTISYANPVPGNPCGNRRLYYRTLKASWTHHHVAPWLGRGYLQISENDAGDQEVTPKVAFGTERLQDNIVSIDGHQFSMPYEVR
jgi:hypothetical protein